MSARPDRSVLALAVAITASAVCGTLVGAGGATPAAAGTTSTASGPALRTLVVQNSVAGFDVSPNPLLNGPITAGTLGNLIRSSQSATVTGEIEGLMQKPGFSSYLRVWTDAGGAIPTVNEIEVGVFELPSASLVREVFPGVDPTSGPHTSATRSQVAGMPAGYFETFATEDPLLASVDDEYGTGADLNFYRTIQLVWFTAGRYIGIVKVLSNDSTTNPDQPHYPQVIGLATLQYDLLAPSATGGLFNSLQVLRVLLGLAVVGFAVFIYLHRRRRADMRDRLFESLGYADGKADRQLPPLREGPTVAMIGHDRRAGGSRDQSGPWDRRGGGSRDRRAGGSLDQSGPWDRRGEGSAGPPGGVERRANRSGGAPGGVERRRGGPREQPVARERRRPGNRQPPPGGVERRRPIEVDTLLGPPSQPHAPFDDPPGSAEPGGPSPTSPNGDGPAAADVTSLPEPAAGTPAGWLPDPATRAPQLRYWDGQSWTTHVALPTV